MPPHELWPSCMLSVHEGLLRGTLHTYAHTSYCLPLAFPRTLPPGYTAGFTRSLVRSPQVDDLCGCVFGSVIVIKMPPTRCGYLVLTALVASLIHAIAWHVTSADATRYGFLTGKSCCLLLLQCLHPCPVHLAWMSMTLTRGLHRAGALMISRCST